MYSKTFTVSALVAVLAIFEGAAAKGINCEGSGLCPRAGWDNTGVGSVMQGLRDAMYSANVSETTHYNNGDHVICVSQSQKITITPGITGSVGAGGNGSPTVSGGASLNVGLTGSIGNGGVCAFAQNTASGITLKDARTAMDNLLQHGCTTCGSDPTQAGNDDSKGELTVNYVANPFCIGMCLSSSAVGGAAGSANPTARDVAERIEDAQIEARWGKNGERMRL